MRLLIVNLFSLVIPLIAQLSLADDFEEPVLPQIWPTIRQDKSYHTLYQLWMQASADRLVIEEWASFEKKLFRLDLIAAGQRITYLSNGNTGEVFRYKPFVCDQLTEDSNELSVISQLFKGFGLGTPERGQSPVAAYGLGPLWMRASADATGIRVLPAESKRDLSLNKLLRDYVGYELTGWLTSNPMNNDFNLRFYFRKSTGPSFVDSIEWIEPMTDKTKKRPTVVARTRTILLDTRPVQDSIFNLPIGYGCKRSAQLELNGRPGELDLDILHEGTPNQALFEVTTSSSYDNVLNKWISQRYLVRVMRGALELGQVLRNYYVATTLYRDRQSAELVRYKQIWSARDGQNYSTVYTINTSNAPSCISNQLQLKNLIALDFPDTQVPANRGINMDFVKWLLGDSQDYHLLRDEVVTRHGQWYEERIATYEKRLFSLNLEDFKSSPVSIVRKVKSLWFIAGSNYNSNSSPIRIDLGTQTKITIFFYSESFDKILAKVKINLLESNEIDVTSMHEQMDIGVCFQGQKQQEVTIKYPMESRELSNALQSFKQPLLEQLLDNLFGTTTIELLQVSGVRLTFDDFFMYLNMRLLDLPLTHTFEMTKSYQIEQNKLTEKIGEGENMIELKAGKFDKCVQACEHYDCKLFSYDWVKLICRIELVPNSTLKVYCPLCELYEYKAPKAVLSVPWEKGLEAIGASRVQLNPQAILTLLKELLTYEASSPQELVPLQLKVLKARLGENAKLLGSKDDVIELKPAIIHSEIDYMDELSKEDTELQALGRYSNMKVEYIVVCNGCQLSESIVFDRIEESSYEECARACESADCRSFSFDMFKLLCLLSQVHSRAEILKSKVKEKSSSIFHVNYLSKFESIGLRIKPSKGSKALSKLKTHDDCAAACMEETEFSCQGMDICPLAGCILTSKHVMDEGDEMDHRLQFVSEGNGEVCFHYARSFLAQFDQYYGRALNLPTDQQVEISDFGAEKCAQSCIHQSCLAFHVCNDKDEENNPRQHCLLATREIKRSMVEKRKHCNTYVLSDRSQFNLHKRNNWSTDDKLRPSKPSAVGEVPEGSDSKEFVLDKENEKLLDQDINKPFLERLKYAETLHVLAHPSWAAGIVYVVLGILLGILGTYIWQAKKGELF